MTFLLKCVFAALCPALTGCTAADEGAVTVKARLDEDALIAEFWTPATPTALPWPAVLAVSNGIGPKKWVLFSSGALHGSWMLSVTVPAQSDANTIEAESALSLHASVFGTRRIMAATGTCAVTREKA